MKVTSEPAVATVIRTVRIEDGPVVQPVFYRRSFRVDHVEIKYTWIDGRYTVKRDWDIRMAGQWIKKDGADAKDRAGDVRPNRSFEDLTFEPPFAFLNALVTMLRPGNDLAMMVLDGAEVKA